jgi:Cu2+-exporting ATPase
MLLGCFFVRAYKSVITWNLNMFTLIGIGSGCSLFSLFGLFFPEYFQTNSKLKAERYIYFEATTVILTLVLLGQLLEKAHSRTSGAIKNY